MVNKETGNRPDQLPTDPLAWLEELQYQLTLLQGLAEGESAIPWAMAVRDSLLAAFSVLRDLLQVIPLDSRSVPSDLNDAIKALQILLEKIAFLPVRIESMSGEITRGKKITMSILLPEDALISWQFVYKHADGRSILGRKHDQRNVSDQLPPYAQREGEKLNLNFSPNSKKAQSLKIIFTVQFGQLVKKIETKFDFTE